MAAFIPSSARPRRGNGHSPAQCRPPQVPLDPLDSRLCLFAAEGGGSRGSSRRPPFEREPGGTSAVSLSTSERTNTFPGNQSSNVANVFAHTRPPISSRHSLHGPTWLKRAQWLHLYVVPPNLRSLLTRKLSTLHQVDWWQHLALLFPRPVVQLLSAVAATVRVCAATGTRAAKVGRLHFQTPLLLAAAKGIYTAEPSRLPRFSLPQLESLHLFEDGETPSLFSFRRSRHSVRGFGRRYCQW